MVAEHQARIRRRCLRDGLPSSPAVNMKHLAQDLELDSVGLSRYQRIHPKRKGSCYLMSLWSGNSPQRGARPNRRRFRVREDFHDGCCTLSRGPTRFSAPSGLRESALSDDCSTCNGSRQTTLPTRRIETPRTHLGDNLTSILIHHNPW